MKHNPICTIVGGCNRKQDCEEARYCLHTFSIHKDAERWRFVRDKGLVWLEAPFEGCTDGRVGDDYATRYVDHLIEFEKRGRAA